MARTATAEWKGDLMGGKGHVALGSGAYEGDYSFATRFEDKPGANPEELLGAAHAGCFSMALANSLAKAGHVATSVKTTASVHLGKDDKGFLITRIDLGHRRRRAWCGRRDVPGARAERQERLHHLAGAGRQRDHAQGDAALVASVRPRRRRDGPSAPGALGPGRGQAPPARPRSARPRGDLPRRRHRHGARSGPQIGHRRSVRPRPVAPALARPRDRDGAAQPQVDAAHASALRRRRPREGGGARERSCPMPPTPPGAA